jgi:hypothetical protein
VLRGADCKSAPAASQISTNLSLSVTTKNKFPFDGSWVNNYYVNLELKFQVPNHIIYIQDLVIQAYWI